MNIFTFFCAPASTITAHRCSHCNENHAAPQTQCTPQLWPNYAYQVQTETFTVPSIRGVRHVQQPPQQPVYRTQQSHQPAQQPLQQPHHPVQQPLYHQLPSHSHHQPQQPLPTPPPQIPTMPPHTALYTLLDLPPTAPPSTIKTSYHRLALLTHPDKNPSPTASERFKALSAAYAILSDPKTRAIYDKHGEAAAGRAEAFDDAGDLVGLGETEGADAGEEDKRAGPGDEGGSAVNNTPRTAFEEPVVEQSTYEDRLLEALRAAHERGIEERRAAGRRLYERFWRGVRGRGGDGMWGWTTRGMEPMDGSCWGPMGDPMEGWRRASVVERPTDGYHGGPCMYNGGMVGAVDDGLRERFRRSRGGGEWSPYGGWERVAGEGYGRFRSWSEGGGGGFVRVVREGYGRGYGRY